MTDEEQIDTQERFTLWQLPSQSHCQMMSYVLASRYGKIIVIDGGNQPDALYLKEFLAARGNHVHAWFVTHPHYDHVDALTEILADPDDLRIDVVYLSNPDEQWIATHEPKPPIVLERARAFNQTLCRSGQRYEELSLGQEMEIDGMCIEILGVKNPELTRSPLNNSSVVMRISDAVKSVLFLADLDIEGGEKLLQGSFRDRLRADYVQMAHHGQDGVSEALYRMVQPSCCLWPTPQWLWENDSGQGKGFGPWKTLEVRAWMDKLNVHQHYVSKDGLCRID